MTKVRSLSPLECTYLAGDRAGRSSMVNQYVIEGIGSLSVLEWKTAIELAADANPGIRLKLKGKWGWRYWDDQGREPRVKVYSSSWSGENSSGAEFDGQELDCINGLGAEIHLLEGAFPKIIFRSHHALMDGNATLFWIQEVFRALRGEALRGSVATLNEMDIVKAHEQPEPKHFSGPWGAIFLSAGINKGDSDCSSSEEYSEKHSEEHSEEWKNEVGDDNCIWQNMILKNEIDRVLPKTIYFFARRVRALHGEHVKTVFRVPSNLRRLLSEEEKYQLGNLVAAIDFEVIPEMEVKDIYKNLLTDLKKKQDLSVFPKNIWLTKWLPKRFFRRSPVQLHKLQQQGLCDITAIITHVGKVSLSEFSYENFKATNLYALPLPLPGVSISCVFLAHDNGLSLTMSAPATFVSHEKLKAFAAEMKAAFSE